MKICVMKIEETLTKGEEKVMIKADREKPVKDAEKPVKRNWKTTRIQRN